MDVSQSTTPPRSSALRIGRVSEAGRIYLITFTTRERLPVFADWSKASVAAAALSSREAWGGSELLCWVLMPDHWHGLLRLGDGVSLARSVGRAKWLVTRCVPEPEGTRLWARGFHDHALRRQEELIDVARYVVLNPVRAGLVSRVGDYPYWDAVWLE